MSQYQLNALLYMAAGFLLADVGIWLLYAGWLWWMGRL